MLARASSVLCALIALAVPGTSEAQSRIRVVDQDSIPIRYALVSVQGAAERVVDTLGVALINTNLGSAARIAVRRLGYAPFDGTVQAGASGEFTVVLQPAARDLTAVRTIAPRSTPLSRTGFYDRMQRVHRGAIVGQFIPPEELERRQISQVSRVLQGVGSVRIERRSDGKPLVTGRGGCGMTIVLDGQRLNSVDNSSARAPTSLSGRPSYTGSGGLSIDEAIIGAEVMAIEV